MFGQHGHNSVYKVHRSGTRLRLAVDDGIGMHIVRYVGNVHAYLIVAVWQLAYRQGIIKVLCILGVDGECHHIAHIFATGHFLVCDTGVNAVGSLFYGGRILVWQTEFGQNSVDFGIVLAGFTQHIHHFAARTSRVVSPVCDTCYHLVAGLASLELWTRDYDVGGKVF